MLKLVLIKQVFFLNYCSSTQFCSQLPQMCESPCNRAVMQPVGHRALACCITYFNSMNPIPTIAYSVSTVKCFVPVIL